MAVPETAMNETDRAEAPKGEVGRTWQLGMESEPDALCMQASAQFDFGYGVLDTDIGHHPRARRLVYDISHLSMRTSGFNFSWVSHALSFIV